ADQIDRKNIVPGICIPFVKRPLRKRDSGVVEQYVQASECRVSLIDRSLDVLFAAHIDRGAEGLPAKLPDLGGETVEFGALAWVIGNEHVGSFLREQEGDGPANAGSGADDNGLFSVQAVHVFPFWSQVDGNWPRVRIWSGHA